MQVLSASNSTVEALSAVYPYDSAVQIVSDADYTVDGYILKANNLFTEPNDVNGTEFTSVFLSSPKSLSSLVTITSPSQLTETFITFLQSPFTQRYLSVVGTGTVGFITAINETSVFEVTFLDNFQLKVSTYDGITRKYLTVDPITLKTSFALSGNDTYQKFYYFFSKTTTQLSLFFFLSSNKYFVEDVGGNLMLVTESQPFNRTIFKTRRYFPDDKKLFPAESWNSYENSNETNTVDTQPSRSLTDIQNNYLTFSNLFDVKAGQLLVSFLPLKNQVTPENDLNRGNIFNQETEVSHRFYSGLHLDGDNITTSYWSGIKRITLPKDSLTYFKFPYVSTPYVGLNVADSSLIAAGAIAGDVPLNSDKVFKQRAPDYINYAITDEQNGTWLCAWLSAGSQPGTSPVWVDRFYNPNFVNFTTALSATTYTDEFTNIVINTGNQNNFVFDLPSRLLFESHALYAYHHLGNKDLQTLIDTRSYSLVTAAIDNFKSIDGAFVIPGLENGVVVYNYTGREFGTINESDVKGSFTVSLFVNTQDFTQQFTDTIISTSGLNSFSITNSMPGILTTQLVTPSATYVLNYSLSGLSFGWHHIAVVNNTELGYFQLYVDALPQGAITFPIGQHTFTSFLSSTMLVGSSAMSATQLKDIRIYKNALTPIDVRNLAYVYSNIRDVKWNAPAGQRNYLDSIERFFKYTLHGRVTGMFNVTIQNSNILDPAVRSALEIDIQNIINSISPAYTKLNQIIWRDNA